MLQLGARYYWPEIGRFISQDPIGEGGGGPSFAPRSVTLQAGGSVSGVEHAALAIWVGLAGRGL